MDSRTAYEVGTGQTRPRSNGTEITTIIGAVLRAMGATLKNLFRKPITVHYPDKERQYPSRYRGLLALTYDKETGEENCIGCRLCEYVCPPAVIKVEMLKGEKRNYAKTFSLELYACWYGDQAAEPDQRLQQRLEQFTPVMPWFPDRTFVTVEE